MPFTVEDRRGLVVVTVDGIARQLVVAVLTVGFVVVVCVMSIIVVDQCAALRTGGVVVVKAIPAECVDVVSFCFLPPDAIHAAVAEYGSFVETVFAQDGIIEFVGCGLAEDGSAEMAYVMVRHRWFLLMCNFDLVYIRRNDI